MELRFELQSLEIKILPLPLPFPLLSLSKKINEIIFFTLKKNNTTEKRHKKCCPLSRGCTCDPALLGVYLREMKIYVHPETCT